MDEPRTIAACSVQTDSLSNRIIELCRQLASYRFLTLSIWLLCCMVTVRPVNRKYATSENANFILG